MMCGSTPDDWRKSLDNRNPDRRDHRHLARSDRSAAPPSSEVDASGWNGPITSDGSTGWGAGLQAHRMGRERPRLSALQRVLAGEFALPHNLVTRAVAASGGGTAARRLLALRGRSDGRAAREWEALELLGEGLTTAEVAERLSIPPDQVRAPVSALQPR
jgi:DNA-binding CsgD family transcriptional regulator